MCAGCADARATKDGDAAARAWLVKRYGRDCTRAETSARAQAQGARPAAARNLRPRLRLGGATSIL